MTIEVTITVDAQGRIRVNRDPIKVAPFMVEEIRWRIIGKSGWKFPKVGGIVIHRKNGRSLAGVRKTFRKKKRSANGLEISVIDVNADLGGIKKQLGKRLRQPRRTFKYDIKLVKPRHKSRRLDPTIENRGC